MEKNKLVKDFFDRNFEKGINQKMMYYKISIKSQTK